MINFFTNYDIAYNMIFNILIVDKLGIVTIIPTQIEAFEILSEGLNIMRKQEYFRKIFLIFFFFISLILSFGLVKTAQAAVGDPVGPYDITDGITNWQFGTVNQVGKKDLGHGLSLGYAFGLASDQNLKVTTGGDSTITNNSEVSGNNVFYSKFNVFLNRNGIYTPTTVVYVGYAGVNENSGPLGRNDILFRNILQ